MSENKHDKNGLTEKEHDEIRTMITDNHRKIHEFQKKIANSYDEISTPHYIKDALTAMEKARRSLSKARLVLNRQLCIENREAGIKLLGNIEANKILDAELREKERREAPSKTRARIIVSSGFLSH